MPQYDTREVESTDLDELDEREPEDDDEGDTTRDKKLGNDSRIVSEDASFIIDADIFQTWLERIDVLVDECRIHVEEDRLTVRAVDPANVGMVHTHIDHDAFESYRIGDEGVIGVPLSRLIDVVKAPGTGDLVHIDLNAERRNLVVSWGSKHEFTISLINPDSIRKEPDLPDLDLPVRVEFEAAGDLHDAIGWADDVSDHVRFTAEDGVFEVLAEGDTDTYHGGFEDREGVRFREYGFATSMYSLDYLTDITRAWTKDETVEMDVGEEFPAEFRQRVTADEYEVGNVTYLLAPRIQSD